MADENGVRTDKNKRKTDKNEGRRGENEERTDETKVKEQTRLEEQARMGHQQETVCSEIIRVDDKVRCTEEEVSDISARVKTLENGVTGNKHPVTVGISYVQNNCYDWGRGSLHLSTANFTPVRNAASDIGHLRTPVKKKLHESDARVSQEAYRAEFEILAGQNGWDDKQIAV